MVTIWKTALFNRRHKSLLRRHLTLVKTAKRPLSGLFFSPYKTVTNVSKKKELKRLQPLRGVTLLLLSTALGEKKLCLPSWD